jgi:signal transduction histidine kinase
MFMYRASDSVESTLFWAHLLYLSAAAIPYPYIFLSYLFIDEEYSFSKKFQTILFIPFAFIAFFSLYPNLLIKDVILGLGGEENIIIFNNTLHWIYGAYINAYFLYVYANFFRVFKSTKGLAKKQIIFVFIGTLTSTIIGVTTNLTLPLQGNFDYNWLGQVTIIIMVAVIFYAVIKHNLFKVKIITTEVFVFSLWGFVILRMLLQVNRTDQIIDGILFVITVVVGVLLIRSVIKEVQSKEMLATAHEQLQLLDKQKSEFISIASHQLRTPMTAIGGYASMLLEGSFGKMSTDQKTSMRKIFNSNKRLVGLIDMLLSISRIESGKLKYEFEKANLTKIVDSVVEELKEASEKKKLELIWNGAKDIPLLTLDTLKLRQVILNIIDNSIKYTKKGSVRVELYKEGKEVLFKVKDTGFGMTAEEQAGLFNKFSRVGGKASASNTKGSGLGLYVARMMVQVHGGKIWAKSEGPDKGSEFGFSLQINPGKLPKLPKESKLMNKEHKIIVDKK